MGMGMGRGAVGLMAGGRCRWWWGSVSETNECPGRILLNCFRRSCMRPCTRVLFLGLLGGFTLLAACASNVKSGVWVQADRPAEVSVAGRGAVIEVYNAGPGAVTRIDLEDAGSVQASTAALGPGDSREFTVVDRLTLRIAQATGCQVNFNVRGGQNFELRSPATPRP